MKATLDEKLGKKIYLAIYYVPSQWYIGVLSSAPNDFHQCGADPKIDLQINSQKDQLF